MIGTIAVISASLLVAALAKRRGRSFTKTLLFSALFSPLLVFPFIVRPQKKTMVAKKSSSTPSQVKPEQKEETMNPYGYKEGGKVLSDSYILSDPHYSVSVSSDSSLNRFSEPQSLCQEETKFKGTGIHM